MSSILNKYFDNMAKNNMISHSFLLCNTNYSTCKKELSKIISTYIFKNNVNIDDCADVYIVKPTEGKIVKEDIINLQSAFMTKSQVNDCKVYIIDEADKMNDYAANSLLKFLEEPASNIYAFLLTNNINKILATIKSRCQILMMDSNNAFSVNDFDESVISNILKFAQIFEDNGTESLAYIYDFINKKEEKESIKTFVKIMKYLYRDILNFKLFKKVLFFKNYEDLIYKISNKNTEHSLVNKLIVLNKYENMLEYNLNLNLFIDKLLIEMGMISNE